MYEISSELPEFYRRCYPKYFGLFFRTQWVSKSIYTRRNKNEKSLVFRSFAKQKCLSKPFELHKFNVRCPLCGGKTVPYFRSHHRKTPVSELSVSSRNSESVGVGRAQTTASGVSDELAVIGEVRRGFAAQQFEHQYSQFEGDLLLHRQPVQAWQNWWDVVASPGDRQKSRCCVLGRLQTPKQVARDTVKQRVAVIEPTGYKRLD